MKITEIKYEALFNNYFNRVKGGFIHNNQLANGWFIDENKNKYHFKNGLLHHESTAAYKGRTGGKEWYLKGHFYFSTRQDDYTKLRGMLQWLEEIERLENGKA